jgi:hypothetical protein
MFETSRGVTESQTTAPPDKPYPKEHPKGVTLLYNKNGKEIRDFVSFADLDESVKKAGALDMLMFGLSMEVRKRVRGELPNYAMDHFTRMAEIENPSIMDWVEYSPNVDWSGPPK